MNKNKREEEMREKNEKKSGVQISKTVVKNLHFK